MDKHKFDAHLAVQATCVVFLAIYLRTCEQIETEALLRWKDSLPDQPILKSWVSPAQNSSAAQSPCSWRGITCDNSSGSVIEINLAYTGLKGTLQYLSFSAFPNLLRLDLKTNNLIGSIPENIGVLSKLQYLDLSTNYLNGTLPISLANLTQVYELDVSRNNITETLDPHLFPDGSDQPKSGLIGIKNLLFQDTLLGSRIPDEVGNIRNLTVRSLKPKNSCQSLSSLSSFPAVQRIAVNLSLLKSEIRIHPLPCIVSVSLPLFFGVRQLSNLLSTVTSPACSCGQGKASIFSLLFVHGTGLYECENRVSLPFSMPDYSSSWFGISGSADH